MCAVSSRACGRGHLGAVVPAAGTPPRRRGRRCSSRPSCTSENDPERYVLAFHTRAFVACGCCRAHLVSRPRCVRIVSCQGHYPNKPTPHASLYHSIACALAKVIFWIELCIPKKYSSRFVFVEREFEDLLFAATEVTVALLMRATRSIWGSYREVLMDSYFTGVVVLVRVVVSWSSDVGPRFPLLLLLVLLSWFSIFVGACRVCVCVRASVRACGRLQHACVCCVHPHSWYCKREFCV